MEKINAKQVEPLADAVPLWVNGGHSNGLDFKRLGILITTR